MILEVISTLALGVVVAVIIDYVIILSKLKQYPPGPIPLPLIGNLHLLHNQPMKAFKHLAKDYGSVMSFSFGRERIVIIQDIDGAREALLTNGVQFAGRCYVIKSILRSYIWKGSRENHSGFTTAV